MTRRELILSIGAVAAWPGVTRGQQPQRLPIVGVLTPHLVHPVARSSIVAVDPRHGRKLRYCGHGSKISGARMRGGA